MRTKFNQDYWDNYREDLVEQTANEYIKDGMSPEDAWNKAEQDVSCSYDLYEDEVSYQADLQYELARDRKLDL